MPKRSRMRRVEGLNHPDYIESYYNRAKGFDDMGEAHLKRSEQFLNRLDRKKK